jgi:hypothetical protein
MRMPRADSNACVNPDDVVVIPFSDDLYLSLGIPDGLEPLEGVLDVTSRTLATNCTG